MFTRPPLATVASVVAALALILAACGQGESTVDPGPEETDTSTSSTTTTTTTTTPDESDDPSSGDDTDEVETADVEDSPTTTGVAPSIGGGEGGGAEEGPPLELLDDTENAAAFIELADSGLVLSVDEQVCVDDTAATAEDDGVSQIDGVIGAVQDCASPRAMDDFASTLILAGGQPLPPTEAACVSSKLRDGDTYRPFWASLLEQEPFDFLLADNDVQNRYLDLYADCVSVGRATAEQTNAALSVPSMGCIDDLYRDREFVRVTIEADLSGNVDDLARIDSQLSSCLTDDERELIYGG